MSLEVVDEVKVLSLTLHGVLVGYLAGFQNGRNVLRFSDQFKFDEHRPTLTLTTHPNFGQAKKIMDNPWVRSHKLHPVLSNLLPEGALRELLAQGLKVHIDNEFQLLSYLGLDLPGALVVEPVEPEEVPESMLAVYGKAKLVKFEKHNQANKFSLAGVQIKFSMKERDGRYRMATGDALGDWIIKTPSTKHKDVPVNEYTAMKLASLIEVEVPEIKLVELSQLENLPPIKLPDEKLAFAIKRFDRNDDRRIHTEDFAQVLVKYPHEKYNSASYEQIGQVLFKFSGDGLSDVQQFARRLLANILLANGDAHLKNWSLVYPDQVTPRLSPAYDIVTTNVYIENERNYALNLGKTKEWYETSYETFKRWAEGAGIPWRSIKPHLVDAMEKARVLWPTALQELPMQYEHKLKLIEHWGNLHQDFQIK